MPALGIAASEGAGRILPGGTRPDVVPLLGAGWRCSWLATTGSWNVFAGRLCTPPSVPMLRKARFPARF